MAKKQHSKRYAKDIESVPAGAVELKEAVGVIKGFGGTKFDQTVELVMHLGIDPRKADQALRGSISLPNGIGKRKKVIAFCEGDDVAKATEAGAVEVGGEELVKKIQDGWMDFDVAIATPAMMKVVSRLGRVLGPSGKMPSPKAGTVSQDIAAAVKDFAAGKVEYRNDDGGNLHLPVGKVGFETDKLIENIDFFIRFVKKAKPTTSKGHFIKKMCISATMTPAVEIKEY
ncbi:MAG: 50S ribosomal protein L1 [Phycisphaerae bacterium]|nr:50S ribosomal protein L1 [Phycisphaerae bacterium]